MNISRSGYYKWLKTKDKLNQYELNRLELEHLIRDIHKRKPSYGSNVINHKKALENMLEAKIKRGYKALEMILHTDQGTVYSSVPYNHILNSYTITRSMSRVGTPTDNPVIESINGWLKKEMYIDFDINNYTTVYEFIEDVVKDNNYYRPSYALNYKTPIEYRSQLGFP